MSFLSRLQDMIEAFNWKSPSWDLFILVFWTASSGLYAFAAGPSRVMSILVSVYISKLLVNESYQALASTLSKLPIKTESLRELALFVGITLILFIFLSRYAFRSSVDGRQLSSLPYTYGFAFLQIGLLISIILGYLPQHVQHGFAPLIKFIFLEPGMALIWLLAPVVYIILLGKFISTPQDS